MKRLILLLKNTQQRMLKVPNKLQFSQYLDSVSKINDSAIFNITPNGISCLVSSIDNTLILSTEFKAPQDIITVINVPDIKKLHRVIDTIDRKVCCLQHKIERKHDKGGVPLFG